MSVKWVSENPENDAYPTNHTRAHMATHALLDTRVRHVTRALVATWRRIMRMPCQRALETNFLCLLIKINT